LDAKRLAHIVAATQAYRGDFPIVKSVLAWAATGCSARLFTDHLLAAPLPVIDADGRVPALTRRTSAGDLFQFRYKQRTGAPARLTGPDGGRSSTLPGRILTQRKGPRARLARHSPAPSTWVRETILPSPNRGRV